MAMSLLSAVLFVGFLGMSTVMDTWQRLDAEARQVEASMRLERTLDGLLANTIPFTWPDTTGIERSLFVGDRDRVAFVSRHRLNDLSEGALRFCVLELQDERLVVHYTDRPHRDGLLEAAPTGTSELATGVSEMTIQYASYAHDRLSWHNDWQDDVAVPLAIRIDITWSDGRELTVLRRTAGSGYYERLALNVESPTNPTQAP